MAKWQAGDWKCCHYEGVTCCCASKGPGGCLLQSESHVEDLIVRCNRCLDSYPWRIMARGLCPACAELR